MSNYSKTKQEEFVELIKEIKSETRDEKRLIQLNLLLKEVSQKRFGLIWEEQKEKVDNVLKSNILFLQENKANKIINSKEKSLNFLIEGENLLTLNLLLKTHKNKIEVIYIDPPYNTKNKDFIYNDNYVDANDKFPHSKWLSFMNKRLKLARELLADNGVILISIDENEFAHLKILCDQIFGEFNFIENFIWIKNSTKNNSKTTSTNHEYILCYSKNREILERKNFFKITKPGFLEVQNLLQYAKEENLEISEVEQLLKSFYKENPQLKGISNYNKVEKEYLTKTDWNFKVFALDNTSSPVFSEKNNYKILHPITKKECKNPKTGWRYSLKTMEEHLKNNRIYFYDDETKTPRFKRFLSDSEMEVAKSVIENTKEGIKEINKILINKNFNNPKPVSLIKYILRFFNKNSIVLDFFAGSGTTAQAVMELNKEDNGKRQFILCTNNENNISRNITFSRIKTVITGFKDNGEKYSNGSEFNLKYLEVKTINFAQAEKEDFEIEEILINSSKLLAELEYLNEINNEKIYFINNEEEIETALKIIKNKGKLFINTEVELNLEQQKEIEKKEISLFKIPYKYYFKELKKIRGY
ncbi:site-specific DNA-methyltransferase [Mycoplasma sp. 480]|uniref:site-specific DNA-methyltransferase n=1 Tax=Mycoplasma sp. 480 TaxID=3440155 RepID=UPI003F518A62